MPTATNGRLSQSNHDGPVVWATPWDEPSVTVGAVARGASDSSQRRAPSEGPSSRRTRRRRGALRPPHRGAGAPPPRVATPGQRDDRGEQVPADPLAAVLGGDHQISDLERTARRPAPGGGHHGVVAACGDGEREARRRRRATGARRPRPREARPSTSSGRLRGPRAAGAHRAAYRRWAARCDRAAPRAHRPDRSRCRPRRRRAPWPTAARRPRRGRRRSSRGARSRDPRSVRGPPRHWLSAGGRGAPPAPGLTAHRAGRRPGSPVREVATGPSRSASRRAVDGAVRTGRKGAGRSRSGHVHRGHQGDVRGDAREGAVTERPPHAVDLRGQRRGTAGRRQAAASPSPQAASGPLVQSRAPRALRAGGRLEPHVGPAERRLRLDVVTGTGRRPPPVPARRGPARRRSGSTPRRRRTAR